jgi:hypothetical protein
MLCANTSRIILQYYELAPEITEIAISIELIPLAARKPGRTTNVANISVTYTNYRTTRDISCCPPSPKSHRVHLSGNKMRFAALKPETLRRVPVDIA